MKNWNTYMMELAEHIATKSKDPSRQVGCVIIGPDYEIRSTGFNGFPRGVRETSLMDHGVKEMERQITTGDVKYLCQCGTVITQKMDDYMDNKIPTHFASQEVVLSNRWERPGKYQWVEHAERNAIYNAARMGIPLKGCTAYITLAPCADCTRGLVQAGIEQVYGPAFPEGIEFTDYGFDKSQIMLREGGVGYEVFDANENTS